jgi:hypothetical protein
VSFFTEKVGRGGWRRNVSFSLVFEGCFGKSGVQNVVFCGENVVKCVVNVDKKLTLFAR